MDIAEDFSESSMTTSVLSSLGHAALLLFGPCVIILVSPVKVNHGGSILHIVDENDIC